MNNFRRFLLGFFLMLGQFFSAQEEIDLENIGERTIENLKRNMENSLHRQMIIWNGYRKN